MLKEFRQKHMTIKRQNERGFIGLLVLLLSVTILIFLVVRSLSALTGQSNNNNAPAGGGFDAINAAKNAKNLIEQNSRNAAQQ
jgi:hypothetical protein